MTIHVGEVRHPRNLSAHAAGSIHDDATAVELGLRGGTVAGNIHLNQFVAPLLDAFGTDWFATGSLSVMFEQPTTDGEPVRAIVDAANARATVRLETPEGELVGAGTATVGEPDERSELRSLDLRAVDASALRILADLPAGTSLAPRTVRPRAARQRALLEADLITEPHPWYTDASPWGGPIACPLIVVDLLTAVEADMLARIGEAVGMYGAIELQFLGAPVLVDVAHDVRGQVIALSESPRTEVIWYESVAAVEGTDVVRMRMMSRLMKASSPLYDDG